jgi:hypothetical protein
MIAKKKPTTVDVDPNATTPPAELCGAPKPQVQSAVSIVVPPATALELDPFAPENLRLDETYESPRPLFTSCPVLKAPRKRDFARVHPDKTFRLEMGLITLDKDEETYALAPKIAKQLSEDDYTRYMLYTAMTRSGSVFLWKVRQPSRDGKLMECHRVLHEAAALCIDGWHRVQWSEGIRNYKISQPTRASFPSRIGPKSRPFTSFFAWPSKAGSSTPSTIRSCETCAVARECTTRFHIVKSGRWILNSPPSPVSGRTPFAWSQGS